MGANRPPGVRAAYDTAPSEKRRTKTRPKMPTASVPPRIRAEFRRIPAEPLRRPKCAKYGEVVSDTEEASGYAQRKVDRQGPNTRVGHRCDTEVRVRPQQTPRHPDCAR